MTNIRFNRGVKANIPTTADTTKIGEPLLATDTMELYARGTDGIPAPVKVSFANLLNVSSATPTFGQVTSNAFVHTQSQACATLGSELNATPATWILGTNWTNNGSGQYTATAGAGALTCNTGLTVANGERYVITWSKVSGSVGGMSISLNGVWSKVIPYWDNLTADLAIVSAGSGVQVTFTPTSDFVGSINNISIKRITSTWNSTFNQKDSAGSNAINFRSNYSKCLLGIGSATLQYSFGIYNVAVGPSSQANTSVGGYNTSIGPSTLFSNTVGGYNVAAGTQAMYSNLSGNYGVAVGYQAGKSNTHACYLTAVGSSAAFANTVGTYKTAIGYCAAYSGVGDHGTTAVGYSALYNNTTSYITGVGYAAGQYNTSGLYNTFIGANSGLNPSNNIAQYRVTTDSYITLLGYAACKNNTSALANSTGIGFNAIITKSNQVVLGNSSVTEGKIGNEIIASGGGEIGSAYIATANGDSIEVPTVTLKINGAYYTLLTMPI